MGSAKDSEVHLTGRNILERHAEVTVEADRVWLVTCDPSAKLWVNGKRIEEKTLLAHDDRIALSREVFFLYKAPCLSNDHNYDYAYILKELGRNNKEFDAEGVVGLLMKSISRKNMTSSKASNKF